MNTANINFKTEKKIKEQASEIVQNMGFSLDEILNAYLKQIVRTQTIYFTLHNEEPSDYLKNSIRKSDQEFKNGNYFSSKNVNDFVKSLDE